MSTSSAQDISSITLDSLDTITITNTAWDNCYSNYTISTSCIPSYTFSPSATISGLTTTQISALNTVDVSGIKLNWPEEWVNCFPEWGRIESMCEEYPGLRIAFEKFKTVYKLVKDDYDTPKDKRPRP